MKLFIGNLSHETTVPELREALSDFEPILDVVRPSDRETGQPRGFAFVTFGSPEIGMKAMEEINGLKLGGKTLKADEAADRGRDEHPASRPRRVSLDVEVKRVDDRPLDANGKRVRYKSI